MDNLVAPAPINVDGVIEAFNAAHPDVVQEATPERQPAAAPPQPQPGQEQVNAVLPQHEQIIPPAMPQVRLFFLISYNFSECHVRGFPTLRLASALITIVHFCH